MQSTYGRCRFLFRAVYPVFVRLSSAAVVVACGVYVVVVVAVSCGPAQAWTNSPAGNFHFVALTDNLARINWKTDAVPTQLMYGRVLPERVQAGGAWSSATYPSPGYTNMNKGIIWSMATFGSASLFTQYTTATGDITWSIRAHFTNNYSQLYYTTGGEFSVGPAANIVAYSSVPQPKVFPSDFSNRVAAQLDIYPPGSLWKDAPPSPTNGFDTNPDDPSYRHLWFVWQGSGFHGGAPITNELPSDCGTQPQYFGMFLGWTDNTWPFPPIDCSAVGLYRDTYFVGPNSGPDAFSQVVTNHEGPWYPSIGEYNVRAIYPVWGACPAMGTAGGTNGFGE